MKTGWSGLLVAAVSSVFLAMGCLASAASGAERKARLTVNVKVEGTESVTGVGSDKSTAKFREGFTFVTYLKTDGELVDSNIKDPQYTQKMMARAAAVHQQVQKAQGKAPAKKMTPEQMKAYVEKKQAACKGDHACLYQLAMEAQEMSMNLQFEAAAKSPAAAEPVEDDTGEKRYLNYYGYEGCGATSNVYVDRTTTGTFGDTTGASPYSVVTKATYKPNPTELGMLCLLQGVLDVKIKTFYSDGGMQPPVRGKTIATSYGRTEESAGEISLHGEPFTWASAQLRKAPSSGTRTTTLKLTQNQSSAMHSGRYAGEARVEVSWKFEEL